VKCVKCVNKQQKMTKTKQKCQQCNKPFRPEHLIWFHGLHLCNYCKLEVGEQIPLEHIKVDSTPLKTAKKTKGEKR